MAQPVYDWTVKRLGSRYMGRKVVRCQKCGRKGAGGAMFQGRGSRRRYVGHHVNHKGRLSAFFAHGRGH